MIVRVLRVEDDGDALWNLRLRALQDNPEAFYITYEETLVAGKEQLLQLMFQKEPGKEAFSVGAFATDLVGIVQFRRDEGSKNCHKGRILSMYVQPQYRGQGVGKALLLEAITQVKQLSGVEQLHLSVITTNAAARSLYQLLGFKIYGTVPHALKMNGQYWDEYLMILQW
jgi:ribosomal protein S18 acetylase RimI-like enzyme